MVIKKIEVGCYTDYDYLLRQSNHSVIFQTVPYLESLKILGYDYMILGVYNDNHLVACFPVQYKKFPVLNKRFYVIPYGGVSYDMIDPEILNAVFDYLKKDGWIIKFSHNEEVSLKGLIANDYHTTFLINLNEDIETLFERLSKTNRNCVRKAEKEQVVVTMDYSNKYILDFIKLYDERMKEKSVDALNLEFLKNNLEMLVKHHLGFFAVASFQGVVYNMAFISTVGKNARYLYGSTKHGDKLPPIGQYLHFEIIKELKSKGFNTYDLGGIPNLPVSEDNPAYSVYKFKKGFGGNDKIIRYDYHYHKYKILKKIIK